MPKHQAKKRVYRRSDEQVLRPDNLYTLSEFERTTGLGRMTRRAAAQAGLELPTLRLGRVAFVEGHAAIQWVRQLAARPDIRTYRKD